ncbi:zinc finger CCCH domain-containing protein 18-like [Pongo pygmaeus]|uniref:zinc finger CCCH domain-containing protein 18-like n=1 Tax=Pongo pygmaeus TaxID=9600 RepID=UPI00300C7D84
MERKIQRETEIEAETDQERKNYRQTGTGTESERDRENKGETRREKCRERERQREIQRDRDRNRETRGSPRPPSRPVPGLAAVLPPVPREPFSHHGPSPPSHVLSISSWEPRCPLTPAVRTEEAADGRRASDTAGWHQAWGDKVHDTARTALCRGQRKLRRQGQRWCGPATEGTEGRNWGFVLQNESGGYETEPHAPSATAASSTAPLLPQESPTLPTGSLPALGAGDTEVGPVLGGVGAC